MYNPLENLLIDPSEFKLKERKYKGYVCASVIVVALLYLFNVKRDVDGFWFGLLSIPILALAVIMHELILFIEEIFHKSSRYEGKMIDVIKACFRHSSISLFLFVIVMVTISFTKSFSKSLEILVLCIPYAAILGSLEGLRMHSNASLNSLLKEKHISQVWAESAYTAYYEKVLENYQRRAAEFENTHSLKLAMKKFVLVIPLSCNVRGIFSDDHPGIEYVEDFPPIFVDQGANINRRYKNPVYKVTPDQGEPLYLSMEQPSSLLVISKLKNQVAEDILRYQRDSFILKLQNYFENKDGVVLVYDDTSPRDQIPLTEFLQKKVLELTKQNM